MASLTRGLVGPTGLLVALALGAWLRWTLPEQVQDLRPRYDALEYEETARSLARGDGYEVVIAGDAYAPCHLFGFPALMAPWLWFADGGFGSGVRVVLLCALAAIAATFLLGATGGTSSAILAAILMATNAAHVSWSRAVMSDVPSTAFLGLLAWLTLRLLDRQGAPVRWAALGVMSGLVALIRQPSLLLLVPTAVLVVAARWPVRARVAALVALACGTAIGLLPMLLYNDARFGSPFTNGFDRWAPPDHFGSTLGMIEPAAGGRPNELFYPRLLAGLGNLYPWPIAVLIAGGGLLAMRRGGTSGRLAILAFGFTATLFAFQVRLVWQATRYLLPTLPLLLATAALPIGNVAPMGLRIAGGAMAVAGIWMTASRPNAYAPPDAPTNEVAALRAMNTRVEPNAIVIAHATTIVFERLLRDGADRALVPVGVDDFTLPIVTRKIQPMRRGNADADWLRPQLPWPAVPAPMVERVNALLDEGRPVYYSPMLAAFTPETVGTHSVLRAAFRLRPVGTTGRWMLFRIERPSGSPARRSP